MLLLPALFLLLQQRAAGPGPSALGLPSFSPPPPAPPQHHERRSVLVWLFTDFYTSDAQLDARVESLAAAYTSRTITTVAPTTHTLGHDGNLQERAFASNVTRTTSAAALFRRLRSTGMRVRPTLFNNEAGAASLPPKMAQLFRNPQPFIGAAVALCTEHGLDGCKYALTPCDRVTQERLSLTRWLVGCRVLR